MEMFLMALCMSVFGLAVSAIAFSAATGGTHAAEAGDRKLQPTARLPLQEPRFFAVEAPRWAAPPRVPIEVPAATRAARAPGAGRGGVVPARPEHAGAA